MVAVYKETARYLEVASHSLYTITFGCESPKAKILLCGPGPTHRLYSLAAWVRWARFLAQHNCIAIRFDYRGTGESTGKFVEMTFEDWWDDILQMSAWADAEFGHTPLVLHGIGMGGLLAQKAFTSGRGDALLLWSPSVHASDVLDQALIMRLSMDLMQLKPENRKSAQQYVADLKSGMPFEAEGYSWSYRLWESAGAIHLDPAFVRPSEGAEGNRPWRHFALGTGLVPLALSRKLQRAMHPGAVRGSDQPLSPDFNSFFTMNLDWLLRILAKPSPA